MGKVNFFMVPNNIFEWGLTNNQMIVLMYLMRCMDNETRLCYPSYDKICKSCGVTRKTAITCIKYLCDKNIIEIVSKGHSEQYGIKKANTYRVNKLFSESGV